MTSFARSASIRGITRLFSTYTASRIYDKLPRSMKRWELLKYGTLDDLQLAPSTNIPGKLKNDQVLIKVIAASVNPIDLEMVEGYGRTAMNALRNVYGVSEFPLVLGRDCSGVIVEKGHSVRRFKIGDEVWCARWVIGDGTHAEFCVAHQSEVALKPEALDHVEAASMPYVACTAWAALVSRAGLDPTRIDNNKKILILGGSGGIGTVAIQLCKALGNYVTTSCSPVNNDLVFSIGADNVIDYRDADYETLLRNSGPYDIILDARRGNQKERVGADQGTIYITLMPPLLPSVDENGLALGLLNAGKEYYRQTLINFVENKGKYSWGLFFPSSGVLKNIAQLVDQKRMHAVVSNIYDFNDAKEALERLARGSTAGKIVIRV